MAEKINLIFKLDGENIDKGIDAFELAQLLTSMGGLIRQSHKALNPSGPDIDIRIKPFEKSSFLLDFLLEFSQVAPIVLGALGPEGVKKIIETLKYH